MERPDDCACTNDYGWGLVDLDIAICMHAVYMCAGRKLLSRAALLLLSIIHFSNLYFPPFLDRESSPPVAMSGQQALQKLKALSPVQQRRAAAILGALLADVASE